MCRRGIRSAVLLLAAALASVAAAQAPRKTLAEDPVGYLQETARAGDAYSQFRLGTLYSIGAGVRQDDEEALRWWRLAAEQGLATAQNEVGTALADGAGVQPDQAEAVRWFSLAAEQGLAVAQANLAMMYWQGKGVRRNDRVAVQWFVKAANQGMGWAQFFLGEAHETGRGAPRDLKRAAAWYRLAADQDYSDALLRVGALYRRDARTLPATDSRSLEAYGEYWVARAARQGNASAIQTLARQVMVECRSRLRRVNGVLRDSPVAEATILEEGQGNWGCVLAQPSRQSRPVQDWVAVYLPAGHVVGFVHAADLGPRNERPPANLMTPAR